MRFARPTPPVGRPVPAPVDPYRPLSDAERGTAGASARRERQRRTAKREANIRSIHPHLGEFLLSIDDDPMSTKVWDQGAIGEEGVGAILDAAMPRGLIPLHDRRIRGRRTNIDHLVVAPNGVWVVDAKRYIEGRIEQRNVGRPFRSDLRLYVRGRDRSAMLDGVRGQGESVMTQLAGTPYAGVPVFGAPCVVEGRVGWFTKPFWLDRTLVTWRKHLVAPMLIGPIIDQPNRIALSRVLADRFPSA